jgi:hypothetical protein
LLDTMTTLEACVKRDMDLIRRILLVAEGAEERSASAADVATDVWDEQTVARHIELMIEAGLIVGYLSEDLGGSVTAFVFRLTWVGHDFLDSVRSDTVWEKTRTIIASTVGAASFEVVKAVAVGFAMKALGL